jgi:hypothetical protein
MLTPEVRRKYESDAANFYVGSCVALVGAMFSVFLAIVIGFEDIAGVFGGIGFFVSIIIFKVLKQSLIKAYGAVVDV